MVTTPTQKITFAEYLNYDDGTNKLYELVDGKLVEMPPTSFLHSDIIDFIADCFKAIAQKYKLDIKVKTGDVGVRTGINKPRIPHISVIDGQVWQSYRTEKVAEYQEKGIPEYWIVDPITKKITVLTLNKDNYTKTVLTGDSAISSMIFPELEVTVREILEV